MLIYNLSARYTSRAPSGRPSRSHTMHRGDRPSRFHTMHLAAGREYRLFRARALRPGNERGCVEPPELERSPQLVTAGRNVRRWCLHLPPPQPLSRLASTQSSPLPPPPCPLSAAPRFHISLIVNNFQFCSGGNSPKQNHNIHTNKYLQKRPIPIMW